jgi:DNA mismatch endonuclease (patch repair protein)
VKLPEAPHASSAATRKVMQGNRKRDTRPELALRAGLHARSLRFRKDFPLEIRGARPTRVDIVFTRARVAVFLDGCFWHGCPQHGLMPKANSHYWAPKLERNRRRDGQVTAALEADGWTVLRIWEHVPLAEAVERVVVAVAASAG